MKKLCIIALLFLNFNCFVLEPDDETTNKDEIRPICTHYAYFEANGVQKQFISGGGFHLIWNDYWENYWYQPGEFLSDYNKLRMVIPASFEVGYTYTCPDKYFGIGYEGAIDEGFYGCGEDKYTGIFPTMQMIITTYDGITIEGIFSGTLHTFDSQDNDKVIGQILITNGSFKSTVGLYYCDQLSADYGCVCY